MADGNAVGVGTLRLADDGGWYDPPAVEGFDAIHLLLDGRAPAERGVVVGELAGGGGAFRSYGFAERRGGIHGEGRGNLAVVRGEGEHPCVICGGGGGGGGPRGVEVVAEGCVDSLDASSVTSGVHAWVAGKVRGFGRRDVGAGQWEWLQRSKPGHFGLVGEGAAELIGE